MISYLKNNKQWIFSGIGVFFIGLIFVGLKDHLPAVFRGRVTDNSNTSVTGEPSPTDSLKPEETVASESISPGNSVRKQTGVSFGSNLFVEFSCEYGRRDFFRLQPLDISLYNNRTIYLKARFCNAGTADAQLSKPRIWYTPSNGQGSVNWSWEVTFSLKPNECQVSGRWGEVSDDSFTIERPFGSINIAGTGPGECPASLLDLNYADSRGLVFLWPPTNN